MTEIEGFVLGVDLGTSHTVAMLRRPDGRTRPLLFDGQPLLPSAVYLDATGRLQVGADAVRLGHAEPGRLEPNPKRRVDDGAVLLGGVAVPVADMLAALLGAVAREAVATAGFLPPAVVTYPAAWGAHRRAVLGEALGKAGWPVETRLVPEPVAAARYFADVLRRPVPVGSSLAVFDFGGGTLDVAVVRNEGLGPGARSRFAVAASGGADDLGGLDLDAALVAHLGKTLAGAEPEAWRALTEPVTLAQWRARRQFWEDVRGAKEMLSRSSFAPVPVPGVEHAVHLTRDELEAAAEPLIRRGVAEAAAVIAAAGLKPAELAGMFLVGGSSRVPLVARLLHSDLGIAPTVLEQPELPVAEGAIIAASDPAAAAAAMRFARGLATAATPTPTPPTVPAAQPPITDTRADASTIPGPPTRAMPAPGRPEEETDERLRAEPVDPWATGEAAALAAGHLIAAPGSPSGVMPGSPPFGGHPGDPHADHWPPVTPPGGQWASPAQADRQWAPPASGGNQWAPAASGGSQWAPAASGGNQWASPAGGAEPLARPEGRKPEKTASRRRGRVAYGIIAVTVTVVVAAGVVLAWVFWPGYRALDYHPLSDPTRIAPAVPVTSDWSDAEIIGKRAYFASSDTESGVVGVVAKDFGATKPAWSSTAAGKAPRWKSMRALPTGVALFTDVDSSTSKLRMAVLGAAHGELLWERTLGNDDVVLFAGDSVVIADRGAHRLLGLKLSDGNQRWSHPDPTSTSTLATNVIEATTPKDLGGPATVSGRAYEPDFTDDPRIVQIGADKSAQVIDADTGKIRTARQNVAEPDDEVVAHNGRLIVLQPDDQRIVSYQLDKLGEPKVLYTIQAQGSQMKDLTPCGDDRVCFDEQIGYDGKSATVVALDVAKGSVKWRYPLADTEALVPVGEAVLATTTSAGMTLIDGAGKKVWAHAGEAARLDGGNLLEFSKPLSLSPDDPAVAGQHLGDAAVPLGPLSDIRTNTCAWNTSMLACVAEKDFVLQQFAG